MIIYDFYIFNNIGNCLFYIELRGQRSENKRENKQKLMFGLIYTLKSFCRKFSPEPISVSPFTSYVTDSYKLHILETHSGLNFIMITDTNAPDQTSCLSYIYSNLFSPFVLRNPFYEPKKPISSAVFRQKLLEHFDTLDSSRKA
ncbi:unnamed protein product [Blepharisma stoltei]|uniref:Trafficking protein particle complex subunit n=1 Tax=Blepharisma stoltei TaxID=1481888 RepID=A0AAU9J2U8_9CILI|nr:unnamed protein product [Blepharisma stoltei]